MKQRWFIVLSEKAREQEIKTLQKRVAKEKEEYTKASKALCSQICPQDFQSEKDALLAVDRFEKTLSYHMSEGHLRAQKKSWKGRPRGILRNPSRTVYRVQVVLEEDSEAIKEKEATKGKFIVATNDLDRTRLSSQDLLDHYQESIFKEQQCVN